MNAAFQHERQPRHASAASVAARSSRPAIEIGTIAITIANSEAGV